MAVLFNRAGLNWWKTWHNSHRHCELCLRPSLSRLNDWISGIFR